MNVGIFYFSQTPGPGRQRLNMGPFEGYIRVETFKIVDSDEPLSDVLDRARPAPDETLMNTHEVDKWTSHPTASL